jgi:signal transduction histidine kinase
MARWFQPVFPPGRAAVLLALGLLGATALAQSPQEWRLYTANDGLGDTYTATVSVTRRGEVVLTHRENSPISILDGYKIRQVKTWGAVNYRAIEDLSGVIWGAYTNGLMEWKDGSWTQHPIREIAREFKPYPFRRARANWVAPTDLGRVLFLIPRRLMEFNSADNSTRDLRLAAKTKIGLFSDLAPARDGGLWIAAAGGVAKLPGPLHTLQPDAAWQEFVPDPAAGLKNFQRPYPDDDGGVVMMADRQDPIDKRVIVSFHPDPVSPRWTVIDPPREGIRFAWAGLDGIFWAATVNALYRRENGRWTEAPKDEISADQYFDLAVETNGVFWLATTEGAFRHTPAAWRPDADPGRDDSPVLAFCQTEDSRLWALQQDALREKTANGWVSRGLPEAWPVGAASGEAFASPDGTILLGAAGKVFVFDPGPGIFRELGGGDGLKRRIAGRLGGGRICVVALTGETSQRPWKFEVFDGRDLQPGEELRGDLPAVGDDIRFVHLGQNGDLWLGGSAITAVNHGGHWRSFVDSDLGPPHDPLCAAEAGEGKTWVATSDRVYEFDGGSWSWVKTGLNRVNSMTRGADGRIWVATSNGLHRYFKKEWGAVSTEDGLSAKEVTAVFEDARGRLWVGTSRGIVRYHPEADSDPPKTVVGGVTTDKSGVTEIVFSARDKWKVTAPDRLSYSYQLDNNPWQPSPTRIVTFADLSPGAHQFRARAMDRNWNVEPAPEAREFTITLPWYLDPRLISISAACILAAVFFAVLALNRHLQLLRSYAEVERIVAERTDQLEKANRQLLHGQKMNALGALAAGVAHDFNNILSIVKGSAQIIESNLNDREKIRARVDRIKTVVDQGAAIVRAMLGFGRGNDQQLAMCDLNATVEDTTRLLGDRALDAVKVEFDWAPGLPLVPGIKDLIQQILLNFIFNAADAMNGTGRIILRTGEFKPLPAGLALEPEPAERYIFASVKDFGVGVAPEIRSRIFEPFFTTKAFSARRGTGLGLSMAYEMARSMGAGLNVESEPGNGSVFTLILPVRVLPAAQDLKAPASRPIVDRSSHEPTRNPNR